MATKRSILARLDRLERTRSRHDAPLLIMSTMPLPERPTRELAAQWVRDGLARQHAGSEHVILYDGGRLPMTIQGWIEHYPPR
jgi:hypothetical protein